MRGNFRPFLLYRPASIDCLTFLTTFLDIVKNRIIVAIFPSQELKHLKNGVRIKILFFYYISNIFSRVRILFTFEFAQI